MLTVPSVSDFKTYFFRDFPYGTTLDTVQDQDITNAITDTGFNINPGLFGTQAVFTQAYLLLTAHTLVMSLRASSQGIAGQYSWLTTSKGVGSVSEGITIPETILKNPLYAMLSKTQYGARYLFMVLPRLVAPVFTVQGGTQP